MVKGIDNQVMIHRSTEYARQMAARNDVAENEKRFAAQLEQQRALHKEQAVSETQKAQSKNVKREGGEAPGQEGEAEERQGEEETLEESKISPGILGAEIDITV